LTGFGVYRTKSCITALLRAHRNDDRRKPDRARATFRDVFAVRACRAPWFADP
jgi:hypothetical protein